MNLTSFDLQAAYYCAAALVRHRQRGGQPIPQWLHAHFEQLDAAVRTSRLGHENGSGKPQSKDELISAAEAAPILGLSKRQVQRIAPDLDGQIVGGRWLFKLSAVQSCAEGRHDA